MVDLESVFFRRRGGGGIGIEIFPRRIYLYKSRWLDHPLRGRVVRMSRHGGNAVKTSHNMSVTVYSVVLYLVW